MKFSTFVFCVFLYFLYGFCEKCSETLHEAFRKGFNLTDACEDCAIKSPEISFEKDRWKGFCSGNRTFLFKNKKCDKGCELLTEYDSVAVVTNETCELVEEYHDLDERCLKKLSNEMFKTLPEPVDLENQNKEKKIDDNVPKHLVTRGDFVTFSLSTTVFGRRPIVSTEISSPKTIKTTSSKEITETTITKKSTTTKITIPTETTNTKETSTESVTDSTATETVTSSAQIKTTKITLPNTSEVTNLTTVKSTKLPPEISSSSTTESHHIPKETCEPNEFFFNNNCYFLKLIGTDYYANPLHSAPFRTLHISNSTPLFNENVHPGNVILYSIIVEPNVKYNWKTQKESLKKKISSDIINSTEICQSRHPKALGLAVETKEENKFILKTLKKLSLYNNYTIFTSGVRTHGLPDRWRGWNSKINQSVLNFKENNFQSNQLLYCINASSSYWYLFSSEISSRSHQSYYMICERPYNPKNIQPELYQRCLELYRESSCYNLYKHSNFCCEKDETGEIWFGCLNETHTKKYPNSLECSWTCENEGFFAQDRPTCKGNYFCSDSYNNIEYIAPVTKYAVSDCPKPYSGQSTWYCDWNRTFRGKPDYSLCCHGTSSQCRDLDAFLNVWMGCPSKKIIKKTACPPGTLLKEAFVEWYCQKNRTFSGTSPDYSNCNVVKIECSKVDRYGVKWVAAAGTIGKNNCPSPSKGFCYWKCSIFGKFDGPEPDCSKCKTAWMEEVAQKIKNRSDHEEVMKIMENYTEKEDLRIGYGQVLALTEDCVVLFKNQNPRLKFGSLDKFLKCYSKILRNLAGSPNLWSSFTAPNREEYAEQILHITQKAAFANLDSQNWFNEQYNATFAKFEEDGFDFFVAYNPSELKFPLQDLSDSNWHLDIKEMEKKNFAVMGFVVTYSLSSLMFPRGNRTMNLEMNSPAVTFTVASSKNGEVVIDPNVVVSISFKHRTRTRFPQTEVIARKLHAGEIPSGVFNSTICYFYRNSDWNTEGCSVTFTSKDRTICTCTHLSTIGLLMSIHKYKPNKTLEFISIMSSSITIVSLILTLMVFYFFDKVKNDRVLIGKNLSFCLLVGHTLLITVMDKKFFNIPDNICTVYAVLLHYVFMAAFAWMFVEGYHLYRMLVLVFDSDIEYRWIYLLIGYGGPFVIVAVTTVIGIIFQEQPYGQDELCWLKTPNYVWAFVGPVIASTSINFCILITSMKLAISSKRRTEKLTFASLKVWIKGWVSLSILLGITWFFGLAYIHYNEAFVYLFVIFNGLQGFFIFIFRCVLCEHYKTTFLKKVKPWFSKLKLKGCKKSENVKSETKLFVISATKSSNEMDTKDSGYDPGPEGLEKNETSHVKSKTGNKPEEKSCGVDIDINITLKRTLSEAHLRNRAIAKNFSERKSKATWLAESCDFPELSYHNIYHPN